MPAISSALWLDDGVSEEGTSFRILPLEFDDRICGSSAAFAIFLDMGGVNDLERWIMYECCHRGEFGAARPSNSPRRFEYSRAGPTVSGDSLSNVVVAARRRETMEFLHRLVVPFCCTHRPPTLTPYRHPLDPVPPTTHPPDLRPPLTPPP